MKKIDLIVVLDEDHTWEELASVLLAQDGNFVLQRARSLPAAAAFLKSNQVDLAVVYEKTAKSAVRRFFEEELLELPGILVGIPADEEVACRLLARGNVEILLEDESGNYLNYLPFYINNLLEYHHLKGQGNILANLVSSSPVMLWAVDLKGVVRFFEGRGLEDLGFEPPEVVGRPYQDVLKELPPLLDATSAALNGEAVSCTVEIKDVVWETRQLPEFGPGGEILGVNGLAFDITDLKGAEAALIAQKSLFQNLVAIARATTEMPTLKATLRNALNAAAEMTGSEMGSMFLLNEMEEVTHSILARGLAEPEEKQQLVNRVMKDGLAGWVVRTRKAALVRDTSQDERWLTKADDPFAPRSALSVPILSKEKVIGLITLTHPEPNVFGEDDLHLIQAAADQMALAIKNAQIFDEQRKLADFQLTLYKVLRTVGSHLDPESVSRVAVEQIVQLTDWPSVGIAVPDEVEETLIVQGEAGRLARGGEREVPLMQGILGDIYRTGQSHHIPDLTKDPDYHPIHPGVQSAIAIPLRRGEHILGVLIVESETTNAFSALDVQLAESLADAISLALENARLFQESRKTADRLRELDRLKSSFLANMSHELRTPLNAILGYSELLQEDAKDIGIDDFVVDLEKIQRAGKHLLAVINDILDISKIEAGRMDLFLESFDIASLVDDVVTTMKPVLDKNENTLEVNCRGKLGSMTADPTKVRQILINLLSNATKFTEKGQIRLTVSRKRREEKEWIVYVVTDTGIGMSHKQLDNLFQPFIQGDISTTRKYGGTGLGLAITRGFCQMMGGDIDVKSEIGRGSRFQISIPAVVQEGSSEVVRR